MKHLHRAPDPFDDAILAADGADEAAAPIEEWQLDEIQPFADISPGRRWALADALDD